MRDRREVELSLFVRKHDSVEETLFGSISHAASGVRSDSACNRTHGLEEGIDGYPLGMVPRPKGSRPLTEETVDILSSHLYAGKRQVSVGEWNRFSWTERNRFDGESVQEL